MVFYRVQTLWDIWKYLQVLWDCEFYGTVVATFYFGCQGNAVQQRTVDQWFSFFLVSDDDVDNFVTLISCPVKTS